MDAIDRLIASDRLKKARIVVVGDAMVDEYVHGRLEIGQEDCPKFVEEAGMSVSGGAANAQRQLGHWNASAALFSQHPSVAPVKKRFLVGDRCVFRHDDEPIPCETMMREQRRTEFAKLKASEFDAVLISDYDKGFLTPSLIRDVIELARERGVPCVADAKREPELYAGAILKCNINYATHFDVNPCDTPSYVITHTEHTPAVWDKEQMMARQRDRHSVPCRNHVGAGDCFAAHLTLALAHGLSLEDAAAIAHSAGRVYVQHPHNRPPWPHEVRKDLDPCRGKIVDGSILNALRQSVSPGRIVFTNGVFRMPHAGHAWLMSWAKAQGDVLVVGVNTDASAAVVKPDTYCLPLSERLHLLASMDAVDWVVPFANAEPCAEIALLKPDVLVKGSEFAGGRIPGDDVVKDVRFAPESPFPERSATTLVAEVRKLAHVTK